MQNMSQKRSEKTPKGAKREPEGAKKEPKWSQADQKTAKTLPMAPLSAKSVSEVAFGGSAGVFRGAFSRHLADFGRILGPSWAPKGLPKSHFFAQPTHAQGVAPRCPSPPRARTELHLQYRRSRQRQQRQQHQRQRTSEYCRTAGLRSWRRMSNSLAEAPNMQISVRPVGEYSQQSHQQYHQQRGQREAQPHSFPAAHIDSVS